MSLGVSDVKVAEMDDDDRLLHEAGLIDENNVLTSAGWEMLKVVYQRNHKQELVDMVKKINASKEQANGTQN